MLSPEIRMRVYPDKMETAWIYSAQLTHFLWMFE